MTFSVHIRSTSVHNVNGTMATSVGLHPFCLFLLIVVCFLVFRCVVWHIRHTNRFSTSETWSCRRPFEAKIFSRDDRRSNVCVQCRLICMDRFNHLRNDCHCAACMLEER